MCSCMVCAPVPFLSLVEVTACRAQPRQPGTRHADTLMLGWRFFIKHEPM